jgi:hypothetical protein
VLNKMTTFMFGAGGMLLAEHVGNHAAELNR